MSAPKPDFSQFPNTISASSAGGAQRYRRVDTHFAVHDLPAAPGSTLDFGTEQISVYPIDRFVQVAAPNSQSTPVYSLAKGGTLAVPTGKVFVRLGANQKFGDRVQSFRDAGYEIEQTLSYAPNAGWLRPASSSIGAALAGLDKLAAIPGVENVEPQMLTKAARKT